jgi:hypothetical protein
MGFRLIRGKGGKFKWKDNFIIGSADKSLGAEWKNDCLDYYNEMNNQFPSNLNNLVYFPSQEKSGPSRNTQINWI